MDSVKKFRVKMRPDVELEYSGDNTQINGKEYVCVVGWKMASDEAFPGEYTWLPRDADYPLEATMWIAEGDLIEL